MNPEEHSRCEVADVFRLYGQNFRHNSPMSNVQRKAMRHIEL